MHQIAMAVHATFFISGTRVNNIPMRQHGAALIRYIEYVAVAFLALLIFEGGIGRLAIIGIHVRFAGEKVYEEILYAMECLGVEKIDCIVGGRQVTVHAVRNKSLAVVDMRRGFPGVVGELDLMAGGAELRCRSSHHGIVGHAEKRKCDDHACKDQKSADNGFFSYLHFRTKGGMDSSHVLYLKRAIYTSIPLIG
jgi:hypothetical protein